MNSVLHSFTSSVKSIPTASSWFEAYVALSTSLMLLQTATNQFIPPHVRSYIFTTLKRFFFGTVAGISSDHVTLTVNETWENMGRNELYDAVKRIPSFQGGESIVDVFDDIKLTWRYSNKQDQKQQPSANFYRRQTVASPQSDHARPVYVLSFDENDREKVVDSYLPHILDKYNAMKEGEKVLKHFTRTSGSWQSSVLQHPATFTLAMEPELRKDILDDLDRFLRRKSFYKKVGKAWKRGYLLYGPPRTGKTSLIAAMANYLKFDVYEYDLELSSVHSNAELMRSLRHTSNRSILVVEDIDCNKEVRNRSDEFEVGLHPLDPTFTKFTLSSLLNSINGLWTSRAEERIIVFIINYKDQIDSALLRPGRMDMHITLSFCTVNVFRILASNYLDVQSHSLFERVKSLLEKLQITPAIVSEKLMKGDDVDVTLSRLVNYLKRKEWEGDRMKDENTKATTPD